MGLIYNFDELSKNGWQVVENVFTEQQLISLAQKLGSIVPHENGKKIHRLIAKSGNNSVKGTFSQRYGYKSFPLHTDTAFWSLPVNHVVMWMKERNACSTKLLDTLTFSNDLQAKLVDLAKKSIFLLKTIERSKFISGYVKSASGNGLRFDPSCMTPRNEESHKFIELLKSCERAATKDIEWSGNKALIMNNYLTLHGRTSASEKDNRVLTRIYINKGEIT